MALLGIQAFIEGLLIGSVYAVAAVGLSLAFGVMRIINWAQGEMLMISMFVSYFLISVTNWNPYLIMFISFAIMFLVGYLLQKTVLTTLITRSEEREPISVLLFTSGLGMLLSNGVMILIGSNPFTAQTKFTGMTLHVGELFISVPKIIAFVIALISTISLYLFLQKSEIGIAIRATSQNRVVATLMGIDQKKIYNLSFALSVGLVGIAGAILIPYYPVSYSIGTTFSFRSFVVVVLGGKGSILGALFGGLIIGVLEKVIEQFLSPTYAQLIVFLLFVFMLVFKPNGLMGERDTH